ncbi:MAG TPA: carbon-nitrogen hydrolase [Candidatus Binatia bacterium]|nr:carbon-nitrogen hydrolase [Candidatus Binatia bacterium]
MTGRGKNARTVTLGLVQMRCGDEPADNLDEALDRIRTAARDGADIVCLQELFRSRYFCQKEDVTLFRLSEPIPGPTTRALGKLAREKRIVIVASIFEKRADGVYHNTAVVLDADGTIVGKYRKMHIPDDPLYYEKFYFTPGDLGFRSFSTRRAKIGTLVCWDQWFPEGARLAALAGAEILVYPTAIGWLEGETADVNESQRDAWETAQRAHAIANGVFVAAVNRVGTEGKLSFWGNSFVADPFGRVLARASTEREETLIVPCDLGRIDEVRTNWPFLRDRRIDAYAGISRRLLDE